MMMMRRRRRGGMEWMDMYSSSPYWYSRGHGGKGGTKEEKRRKGKGAHNQKN